jgi:glutathione S-transferase
MAGVAFDKRPGNPAQAPKGKVPYVELDGVLVGDSQVIIERLSARDHVTLDQGMRARDHALGRAVRRMLEEGTYWSLVHARWLDDTGWATYKPDFGAVLPAIARPALPLIRRQVRKSAWAHGAGRHDGDTAYAMGAADLAAVAELITGPFFFGAEPRSVDAVVYAMAVSAARFPVDSPVRQAAQVGPLSNLIAAVEERFYRDDA